LKPPATSDDLLGGHWNGRPRPCRFVRQAIAQLTGTPLRKGRKK